MAITMVIFVRGIIVLTFISYALQFCNDVCAVKVAKCYSIANYNTLHFKPTCSSQEMEIMAGALYRILIYFPTASCIRALLLLHVRRYQMQVI